MDEIYWITRMGEFGDMCIVITIVGIIVIAFILCVSPLALEAYNDLGEAIQSKIKKTFMVSLVVWILFVIGHLFIPSKKDVLLIYGLGSTVDYVKSNDKAKQLPDKCIDALTRYVDSIEKENEGNNK